MLLDQDVTRLLAWSDLDMRLDSVETKPLLASAASAEWLGCMLWQSPPWDEHKPSPLFQLLLCWLITT